MNTDEKFLTLAPNLTVTSPAASYANAVVTGNLLFLAGKIPLPDQNGVTPKGILGREYSIDAGYQFARSAALDLIGVIRAELGTLERVSRIVKIQGFIRATEDFDSHHLVLNGASDLFVEVFGDRGVHARSVLGAISLRGGAPLVLEGVVEFH